MKTFGYIVAALFALTILTIGAWAVRWYTAEVRGAINAQDQIESAASRIPRYEQFFDLCAAIQQHEATITAQESRLESITDNTEASRVRGAIAALASRRAGDIARYNADARQYTSGRFRDASLPYQLDPNGVTTCR